MTVYDVALSDSFVHKLRPGQARASNAATVGSRDPASLTLRFSAPPDTLESHKSELELRRASRGEYTLQQASDQNAARDQGQGQGQGPAGPSGPTFKGSATVASDVECVLVYDQQYKQYVLHPIGLDMQMAPALKPRTKAASAGSKAVLREPPASSKPTSSKPASSKLPISRQSSVRPSYPASGAASASAPSSSTATPVASPKLGASGAPMPVHHPTAMLPPRRATKARLPTRKTLKKAKLSSMQTTPTISRNASAEPEQAFPSAQRQTSRSGLGIPSVPGPASAQGTPRSSPQKRSFQVPSASASPRANAAFASDTATYEDSSAAPSPQPALDPQPKNTSHSRAEQSRPWPKPEHVTTSSASSPTLLADEDGEGSHFDDDLDGLADELADELGEDDENTAPVSTLSAVGIGTALNSIDDGEDTSEEE